MPYKDFAVGEILTSSDVDAYLMTQVIIRCTSGTRPASPAEGWHIYETDTQRFLVYKSGVWVLEGGQTRQVTKSADQSVISTTTVVDDTHLFMTVDANTNYLVETLIIYGSLGTADFRMAWSGPAGAAFTWVGHGIDTGAVGSLGTVDYAARNISTSTDSSGFGGDMIVQPTGRLVIGGTAGTFRFRFAQGTSTASNTTVRAGSVLMLTALT